MYAPILSTKLSIPVHRSHVVDRPRLIVRLDKGMYAKLILVSAPAGSGKTLLVNQWVKSSLIPTAWLSLEEADNDLSRFLTYLCASLQTIFPKLAEGIVGFVQSSEPPPVETVITYLLNEISDVSDHFVLVLDDYHLMTSEVINQALVYLLRHIPPHMHLVMITRQQPKLPLARLRAKGELIELRGSDLRFNSPEISEFLDRVMRLKLSKENIALLEERTEGWVAGLQLAALSMQGFSDPNHFMETFSGTDPFVLDYLMEEILQGLTEQVQNFLLKTCMLDRLCGSLCDAIFDIGEPKEHQSVDFIGQDMLEWLEQANLFIIPLDNERRWYRYHHLFADLLRKRVHQTSSYAGKAETVLSVTEIHKRASIWFEKHQMELEAFNHAVAAADTYRASNLLEGKGMPLLFRGGVVPALQWLGSLSSAELDSIPSLWVMYAAALLVSGHMIDVEPKLQSAEQALQDMGPDQIDSDLIGHIASIRATLAVSRHDADTIIAESLHALQHLHPHNLPIRAATAWTLGYAYQLQRKRAEAELSYLESLANSTQIGHHIITMMATLGVGNIQESNNQLHLAAESYQQVLNMAGKPPLPIACEAHLGLARVHYEWNNLDVAMLHAQHSVQLAHQFVQTDRVVASELWLARVTLAKADLHKADIMLDRINETAQRLNFTKELPDITAAYVLALLRQGDLKKAMRLSWDRNHALSQARVLLRQGNTLEALGIMESCLRLAITKGFKDEQLKATILLAVIHEEHGTRTQAIEFLTEAMTMAEPAGFIRVFVDEGVVVHSLLKRITARGDSRLYLLQLLAAFDEAENIRREIVVEESNIHPCVSKLPIDPLSARELEVLHLIAQGRSNREISEILHIALPTVKGHNRIIFDKMQVKRRTEAVAKAREWKLL
ncbi:LuxR C-terminal-related transcriptional regulator [Paenibacillus sp. UASWS1643]|uniref:LuxR C-terminal-related transcriptional regulator n=1 Tax=Paenibacillus sp. UASWS1643 TaxID=2580422 RepID=UPI001239BE7A|nr:LuxR C-terminal-related transcriptional regulator [Paenibacillus sp. UASWS1643]KAA8756220.1 LuxR family transcriptional regulator [Paenibacillus sp. UASWS1643]